MLIIPWFKKRDTEKTIKLQKRKRTPKVDQAACTVSFDQCWAQWREGRWSRGCWWWGGVGTSQGTCQGPFAPGTNEGGSTVSPQTNTQWNKRTEAPRKVGPRVWDSYQALSQNHFPGNGNIFVFGNREGVSRQARAKTHWSLDNCYPTEGPCGRGFKVLLLRPPQWVCRMGRTQRSPCWSGS